VDTETIQAIERIIAKGDRVELIPEPGGTIKVLHIRRKIIKSGLKKDCPKR